LDEAFIAHDVPMCRQRIDRLEWRSHGGCDLGDVAEWSDRACGMAALRMILLAHHRPAPPLTELLKLGMRQGALSERGWLHTEIASLAGSLGVTSQAHAVPAAELPVRLEDGPLIASVTIGFPDDERRGGHLVVLRGYERNQADPSILFRDPSAWGQANDRVKLSRLARSYTGRCITFQPLPAPP
jgi:ABC-type bacteriocin/lantibiotic exporter with double-glycine peptidase domain